MRKILAVCGTAMLVVLGNVPAFAQSAPGQTVNVTPNQQTTTASAVSSPSGQNISQQNNFYDPGVNAFGPGIQCGGPYLASSAYRNDASNPGSIGGFSNTGGTIGFVLPINGSSKKCQEFVNEIVFQRQIDTCLAMAKQGFSFDPAGQYAYLAKRCAGIKYTGQPIGSANPVSPAPPPTVITVPASPQSNVSPLLNLPTVHAAAPTVAPAGSAAVGVSAVGTTAVGTTAVGATTIAAQSPSGASPSSHAATYCQEMNHDRKKRLIARVKSGVQRKDALETLHAACVTDAEIMAAL